MDIKTIWTSKTVWGAVAMIIPFTLKLFGFDLAEADITTALGMFQEIIDKGLTLVGFIMVVYGRMHAKAPATILPK